VYALGLTTTTPRCLRSRHRVSLLFAHLVVVVKYRRRVLSPALLGELRALWTEECQHLGAVLVECNGEADHVLLLRYPPSLPLWRLVQQLKGVASRTLRQRHPHLRRVGRGHLWSSSYFVVSTGGAPIELVRRYIEQQSATTALSPD
jgi:putative transposase